MISQQTNVSTFNIVGKINYNNVEERLKESKNQHMISTPEFTLLAINPAK